jgi:hypothetical protein
MDLYCTGTPAGCSSYRSQLDCTSVGCEWTRGSDCTGVARACADLNAGECASAPGCSLIGASDAGAADAGGRDGAVADAGPEADAGACDPATPGECHPYFDADCGCELSRSDSQYACGRSGSIPEGGRCDDFGQCAGGLLCLQGTNFDEGECRRRCAGDTDCASGERCAFIDEDSDAPCTGYCLPVSECSIATQDCPTGEGCYLLVDDSAMEHSFCHPAGSGAEGDACFNGRSIACEPGLVCAQDPVSTFLEKCQPLCMTDDDCDVLSECTGSIGGFDHCR